MSAPWNRLPAGGVASRAHPDSGPGLEVSAALPVATLSGSTIGHNGVAPITPSWAGLAMIFLGGLFLMVLALVALLALKRVLHGSPTHQDDAAVQELYHLGKSLESRMDALETILLERQRATQ